jgi:tetratricopeptide (TPR) repeat protein
MLIKRFYRLLFACSFLPLTIHAQSFDREQLLDMISLQRYKEAAAYIRLFYTAEISDPKLQSRLAYCYFMSGSLALAEKEYTAILSADSMNRIALSYLAAINEQRRNYVKAKQVYQKILGMDSLNVTVYAKVAATSLALGDSTGYIENLTIANQIDPQNPDMAYDLAMFLIRKKRYTEADAALAPAAKADPENIVLLEALAELSSRQKKWQESVDYSRLAITQGSRSPQVINLLGIGLYYTKKYKECIEAYSAFEGTANANETTYYYMALAYRQLGDLKTSNEYLVKSIHDGISGNVPIYYQELSANNKDLKKYVTSLAQLNKAEEFDAKNILNYSRARLYDENLNDKKNALKFFNLYLKNFDETRGDDKECYLYSKMRVEQLSGKAVAP